MQHNATITRKTSTSYTNSISNIRVLNQMVQKLGKYHKGTYFRFFFFFGTFFFEASPNINQALYTSVVSNLAKFYEHPSSNGIPRFLRTFFLVINFERGRHNSVYTRQTEKKWIRYFYGLSILEISRVQHLRFLRDRPPIISFDTD